MLSGEVMTIFNNSTFFSSGSSFPFHTAAASYRMTLRLHTLQRGIESDNGWMRFKYVGIEPYWPSECLGWVAWDQKVQNGTPIGSEAARVHLLWAFVINLCISNNFTLILPNPQACLVVGFLPPDFSACFLEPFSGGSLPPPLCQNG